MLKQLYINNFTLIDTLDIHFNPGFSVITGETGAGKSIVLGAINLLLGQRADIKSIKHATRKCIIEAHFDISRYGEMRAFFDENGIDYDADDCILRREISPSGKSRSFINDTPVPLTTMRTLGSQLVDIHSQHQNLLLGEEDFQLDVVDIIAADKKFLTEYKVKYAEYREAVANLKRMEEELAENKKNEDFIRFQLEELAKSELTPEMQDELERERELLKHSEEVKTTLYNVLGSLDGSIISVNGNILESLRSNIRDLESIANIYPEAQTWADRISSCHIELCDLTKELDTAAEDIGYDPRRLETVENMLDTIYTLENKHSVKTVEELITLKEDLAEKLEQINNGNYTLDAMRDKVNRLTEECGRLADRLTNVRTNAAKTIEHEMPLRLAPLGMPKVKFAISIERKELSPDGQDRVSFLFSANTGIPMQPVAQVASGGEISRVMLSLKAMISGAVKLPTIIFDEIDTGVSGKIAEKMGDIMQEMARAERQVVSITHLPQIAAKGTTHYKVYKEDTQQVTTSQMRMLNTDERINEIAQMLSGSEITEAAVSNAKELLKQQ